MIPGMLIQVKPYRYMTSYYKLLTPEEYMQQMQDRKLKSVRENTMDLQDLKYWVDEGGNPKDIIEAISFIRETLLIYQMTVYPPISEKDE